MNSILFDLLRQAFKIKWDALFLKYTGSSLTYKVSLCKKFITSASISKQYEKIITLRQRSKILLNLKISFRIIYFAILRNFRCPLPHPCFSCRSFCASTLAPCRHHPLLTVISWFLYTCPFCFCDAPPCSNSIGTVHILLRFSDWLNHWNCAGARYCRRKNGDVRGWNPGESIRGCPPVTRQSGLILCEERVGNPRARSVTSAILIRTVHCTRVFIVVVIVVVHQFWFFSFFLKSRALRSWSAPIGKERWWYHHTWEETTMLENLSGNWPCTTVQTFGKKLLLQES